MKTPNRDRFGVLRARSVLVAILSFVAALLLGGLTVTTAEQALPGDAVVEQDGAKVYLDETAAVALGDQVLDAAVDETGGVQFSLLPSSPAV